MTLLPLTTDVQIVGRVAQRNIVGWPASSVVVPPTLTLPALWVIIRRR